MKYPGQKTQIHCLSGINTFLRYKKPAQINPGEKTQKIPFFCETMTPRENI